MSKIMTMGEILVEIMATELYVLPGGHVGLAPIRAGAGDHLDQVAKLWFPLRHDRAASATTTAG